MAKGEIVVVVNSDDPLLPGAVSEAAAFMQAQPDILVAYPDWNLIGPDSEIIRNIRVREYDYLYMLRRHYCIPGPAAFIRRKAFELAGMRDPEFRYRADIEFWLRLGLFGRFARIPKTLATWREHPGAASFSQRGVAMADEHVRLIRKLYSRPDLPPEVEKVRGEAFGSMHFAAAAASAADRREAKKHLLTALKYSPRSLVLSFTRVAFLVIVILPEPAGDLLINTWRAGRRMRQNAARFLGTATRNRARIRTR